MIGPPAKEEASDAARLHLLEEVELAAASDSVSSSGTSKIADFAQVCVVRRGASGTPRSCATAAFICNFLIRRGGEE